jgi:hypothetical protein
MKRVLVVSVAVWLLGKAGWRRYFDQGNRVGFSQGNAVLWLEFSPAGEGWSFLSFAR